VGPATQASQAGASSSATPYRAAVSFNAHVQAQGGSAAYVQKRLEQMPQVSVDDRAKLVDGARQDLGSTLRHLVDHNCRILLRSHFDEGASRAWLLKMIDFGRGPEGHAG
jgi:hypothetical protein